MHLAYLDDSGTDAKSPIVVVGGIVVPDASFEAMESEVGWVVEQLIPQDRRDQFAEFHAAQLFGGFELFAGIEQADRYEAIHQLLGILTRFDIPFIYSAVSKRRLAEGPFASALPIDVAFRLCALGIENWLDDGGPLRESYGFVSYNRAADLCLLVVDDTDDKAVKVALKRSFKAMRLRRHGGGVSQEHLERNRLWHLHDDMYFGDSKDSVGIQIADLCNYFMMRKLRGEDDGDFFDMLEPHAVCATPEPEYSQCREWLLRHNEDVSEE